MVKLNNTLFHVPDTDLQPFNPLGCKSSNSATLNNMKLVHWPLMGVLLHVVQRGRDCMAGPQPSLVQNGTIPEPLPIESVYSPDSRELIREIAILPTTNHAGAYTINWYSLYRRFRPLTASCVLAQWVSSSLLRFDSIPLSGHNFFVKFYSVSLRFLYNFSIVTCHLFS